MGDYIVSKSFVIDSTLDLNSHEGLVDDLSVEIQDKSSSIGLDEYFRYGGAIDEVWVEDLEITGVSKNGNIHGKFSISFDESYHGGCRNITWSDTYSGTMSFVIDLETREFTVTDEEISLVEVSDDEEEEK